MKLYIFLEVIYPIKGKRDEKFFLNSHLILYTPKFHSISVNGQRFGIYIIMVYPIEYAVYGWPLIYGANNLHQPCK